MLPKGRHAGPLNRVNQHSEIAAQRFFVDDPTLILKPSELPNPGQRGDAVADVLFGKYNPGGKLPVTFYKSTSDLPPFLRRTRPITVSSSTKPSAT